MNYMVKVGRDGFTEGDIKAAVYEWNELNPDRPVSAADFDGLVNYMRWSWRDFPPHKTIEETDSSVWLRRDEIDCIIANYLSSRNRR